LLTRLAEQPDVTLRALLAELAARGIKVSYYAVWHFFEHEGISFKKKLCTPASRIDPTSPDGEVSGASTRTRLIQPAWSSSMRRGPRQT
jgi:transposase